MEKQTEDNRERTIQRDERGHFIPGSASPSRGRPRGVPNKLTTTIKAAIEAALEAEGGVEYMRKLAREEPAAFASLLRALVPAEVKMAVSTEPEVSIRSYVRAISVPGQQVIDPAVPVVAITMVAAGEVIG